MLLEGLTIPIIIGAALVDSINPCVFGVLIFLIAFMTKVFKSHHRMLIGGIIYTTVVYASYFLIGLGFLKFTVSFGLSVAIYWIAATIAIIAGLVKIKDKGGKETLLVKLSNCWRIRCIRCSCRTTLYRSTLSSNPRYPRNRRSCTRNSSFIVI